MDQVTGLVMTALHPTRISNLTIPTKNPPCKSKQRRKEDTQYKTGLHFLLKLLIKNRNMGGDGNLPVPTQSAHTSVYV